MLELPPPVVEEAQPEEGWLEHSIEDYCFEVAVFNYKELFERDPKNWLSLVGPFERVQDLASLEKLLLPPNDIISPS